VVFCDFFTLIQLTLEMAVVALLAYRVFATTLSYSSVWASKKLGGSPFCLRGNTSLRRG
jgi:hypothetical protein